MPLYENDGQGEEIPLGSIPKGKILKRDETTGALIGVDPSAPGAHTHPESEITNLVTDLSGKAASSHGHAQSEVTGLTDALGGKCASNDSRLSDARTPTAHGHAESEVTNLVTDLAAKETPSGAQAKVDAHKDLTTGVHGAGAGTLDTVALRDSAISTHAGIAGAHHAAFTQTNHDALPNPHHSNANDPTADEKAALAGTSGTPGSGNKFVTDGDARNTDARTPTTHSHAPGDVTGTAVITNDSRLSDARTPTAHNQDASTINAGTLDGDRLPSMSATKKGAVPMTGTPSGKFLKDDGTFATTPAGTPASTVTDETTWGIAKAVGSSTNYAREDHTHGSQANPVTRANGAPVYAALANDTLAQNYAVNSCTKLTVTAARTLTTTVPPAGCDAHTIILTSGTTSYTITFGTGFKPTGTLATGTTSGRVFVIHWISDGTNLYESGRTAAMVA